MSWARLTPPLFRRRRRQRELLSPPEEEGRGHCSLLSLEKRKAEGKALTASDERGRQRARLSPSRSQREAREQGSRLLPLQSRKAEGQALSSDLEEKGCLEKGTCKEAFLEQHGRGQGSLLFRRQGSVLLCLKKKEGRRQGALLLSPYKRRGGQRNNLSLSLSLSLPHSLSDFRSPEEEASGQGSLLPF